MTNHELHTLATYNSEVSRGIMHTEEWQQRMDELQRWYDAEQEARIGLVRMFKTYPTPTPVHIPACYRT